MVAPGNTVVWVGDAQDVSQVDTITISGTWTAGETASATINGKSITFTVVSGSTATTDVASGLQAAIEAQKGSYGEWSEVTATVLASVVTLTWTAGKPHTISVSESSASGGIALSNTTAATGKHFADNTDNYAGGALPGSSDTVIMRDSTVSVKYALDAWDDIAGLRIYGSYNGEIGLATVNVDNSSYPYTEYRRTHLKLADDSTNTMCASVEIGVGSGTGPVLCRLDFDDEATATSVTIYSASTTSTPRYDVINANDLTFRQFAGNSLIRDCTTVTAYVDGGTLALREIATSLTLTQDAAGSETNCSETAIASATVKAGTLNTYADCDVTAANISGTWNDYGSGDVTGAIVVYGSGAWNIEYTGSKTFSGTIDVYDSGAVNDPNKTISSLVIDYHHGASPAGSDFGDHVRLTRGTVS